MVTSRIEANVLERLRKDERLPSPDEIAVKAVGAEVTLRGTVGSFAQRRAAVRVTRSVEGVSEVNDQLRVRILSADRREDAEIRGTALQRLAEDTEIPSESIDVEVRDGWATLKGEVDFQFQSDAAFDDVSKLYGVMGITNEIRVVEEL
jgi:osmotically-inducible protein OsmY